MEIDTGVSIPTSLNVVVSVSDPVSEPTGPNSVTSSGKSSKQRMMSPVMSYGGRGTSSACYLTKRMVDGEEKWQGLVCAFCGAIANDAIEFKCGHMFGKACGIKLVRKDGKCNVCAAPCGLGDIVPNKTVTDRIGELQITCGNDGCSIVPLIKELEMHQHKDCSFRIGKCPHCLLKIPFYQLAEHEKQLQCICGELLVACIMEQHNHFVCSFCNQSIPSTRKKKHAQECSAKLSECSHCKKLTALNNLLAHAVPFTCNLCHRTCPSCQAPEHLEYVCANGCGEIMCLTSSSQHSSVCPLQEIACPFELFGCKFKCKKSELEPHILNANVHLLLGMSKIVAMQQAFERDFAVLKHQNMELLSEIRNRSFDKISVHSNDMRSVWFDGDHKSSSSRFPSVIMDRQPLKICDESEMKAPQIASHEESPLTRRASKSILEVIPQKQRAAPISKIFTYSVGVVRQSIISFTPCFGSVYNESQDVVYFFQTSKGGGFVVDCKSSTVSMLNASGDLSISQNSYTAAVLAPQQMRVYFVPSMHTSPSHLHYYDITANTIVSYSHTLFDLFFTGGIYDEKRNRIYLLPHANLADIAFIECGTGKTCIASASKSLLKSALAFSYAGGVFVPEQDRIYLVPCQGAQNWHYIDCASCEMVAYPAGKKTKFDGYFGGAYSPLQKRVYFAPLAQSQEPEWHYLDVSGSIPKVVTYVHGISSNALVNNAYRGAVYSAANNCIVFVPSMQPNVWHYIDCTSGRVCSQSTDHNGIKNAYRNGIYAGRQGRVYFTPWEQSRQLFWHFSEAR